ncbi:MAG: PEP/pyruvate-binding domain-containing protein [Actinomycetota bacterium]
MNGTRLTYAFDADRSDLDDPVAALGGKGAGLAEMTALGLPVPPGFTLTTEACRDFLATGWDDDVDRAIAAELTALEATTGKALGSPTAPLLVSVRSGAKVSMPGMMDTVLNLGMNPTVEKALAALTGDPAFAADTRRRALLGYAEIVLGAPREILAIAAGTATPDELAGALRADGFDVPTDPMTQIAEAVRVVFESWNAPRAVRYRDVEGIDHDIGTAATVQTMVFGNLGDRSGTGVAFTRDPASGAPGLMGDFLLQAQGEDVVAGTNLTESLDALGHRWPEVASELDRIAELLEQRYRDMVDIEFTVEQGRLWLLQARPGKRSPIAAFRAAIDMADDPDFPVDHAEAVERCRRYLDDPPTIADESEVETLTVAATGLAASPGRGCGVLVLDPDRAVELSDQGIDVVLARRETSPADVHGMAVARGLFTTLGGLVSHAALVAREWGIPAVVGAAEAEVDATGVNTAAGHLEAGTVVTVDGHTGRLLIGRAAEAGTEAPEVTTIRSWATRLDRRPDDSPAAAGSPTGSGTGDPGGATDTATSSVSDADLAFRVLHALRIKGMAGADSIAALADVSVARIRPELDGLVERGHATFMEPRSMWLLSADGREGHGPELAAAVDGLDLDAIPYDEFLAINDAFKQLCTDWQLRDGDPNDHSDADYDAAIVARLGELDERAQPVVAAIGAIVPWMVGYGQRLGAARARIESGDPKGLTGVMCDSYHDIWMELHEDLILTKGIDRAQEGSF